MAKIVTVIETWVCRSCKGKGSLATGESCGNCTGRGNVEVEVLR